MANTFKTNLARKLHKIHKTFTKAFQNKEIPEEYDALSNEVQQLTIAGGGIYRYGNHRRWIASMKVVDRRKERKSLNRFDKNE